jgi:hypothetical protein
MIEANRVLLKRRLRLFSYIQQKEYLALGAILFLTFLNGLVFTFIVPPWQHYDEPTNFEYAWLIANKPGLPKVGDYDASMRRQVAASMIQHGFFAKGSEPDLSAVDDPVWIGISQIEDRPFAYWVISLPLRLFSSRSITFQLYVGRMVSVFFYLLTVISAWGIIREVTHKGSSLRWIFPITLAILPSLSNLMTSLNSDAGAVGIFSLFLWGSIRLIQRGFSAPVFLAVSGLVIICLLTKLTVFLALPLFGLVLIFTFSRGHRRKWAWSMLIIGFVVFVSIVLALDDAAYWYRSTTQNGGIRSRTEQSVLGEYAFALELPTTVYPSWHRPLFQPILLEHVVAWRGNPITLGAWIWSTGSGNLAELTFGDGINTYRKNIILTAEPTFYALKAFIDDRSTRGWVMLGSSNNQGEKADYIYFDSVVLAGGERPTSEPPVFDDKNATEGLWGGINFNNLVRNASGELGTIRFHSWFDRLWSRYLPNFSSPSFNLHYLLDFEGVNWHYKASAYRLFTTFWGQFGWGNVPLKFGPRPYSLLGVITLLTLLGGVIKLIRCRKTMSWESMFLLGLAALGIGLMAVLRGTSHLSVNWMYLPVARYAYPAVIPLMLLFTAGFLELLHFPSRLFRCPKNVNNFIFITFIILLNFASITTIVTFYG